MAIEIEEQFEVAAPVEAVWAFLLDPARVVTCMPGAALDEIVDAENFKGRVRVKLGAVGASYKGKVNFVRVDVAAREVEMKASGREAGGGTASARILSKLTPLESGTAVSFEARVDITGKIVQVGGRMIKGISHQLFQQFAASTKALLEATPAAAGATAGAAQAPSPVTDTESNAIRVLPLLLQTLWAAISRFVRKLFGRATSER